MYAFEQFIREGVSNHWKFVTWSDSLRKPIFRQTSNISLEKIGITWLLHQTGFSAINYSLASRPTPFKPSLLLTSVAVWRNFAVLWNSQQISKTLPKVSAKLSALFRLLPELYIPAPKNELRNYIYTISDIFICVKMLKLQFCRNSQYCGKISERFNL